MEVALDVLKSVQVTPELNPSYEVNIHQLDPLPLFSDGGRYAIKMYGLEADLETEYCTMIDCAKEMLSQRISQDRIDLQSRVGFCVVSPDCVNLTMWGRDVPSLGHQSLFIPKKQGAYLRFERQQDLSKSGSYCMYEAQVLAHESLAWRRYLLSGRDELDLKIYLSTILPKTEFLVIAEMVTNQELRKSLL